VGYDFTGPRFELEGVFRGNNGSAFASFGTNGTFDQLTFMVNGLYDFLPGATLTPYVGAASASLSSTAVRGLLGVQHEFAYQAIVGMSWRVERRCGSISMPVTTYHHRRPAVIRTTNQHMLSVSYRLD